MGRIVRPQLTTNDIVVIVCACIGASDSMLEVLEKSAGSSVDWATFRLVEQNLAMARRLVRHLPYDEPLEEVIVRVENRLAACRVGRAAS